MYVKISLSTVHMDLIFCVHHHVGPLWIGLEKVSLMPRTTSLMERVRSGHKTSLKLLVKLVKAVINAVSFECVYTRNH